MPLFKQIIIASLFSIFLNIPSVGNAQELENTSEKISITTINNEDFQAFQSWIQQEIIWLENEANFPESPVTQYLPEVIKMREKLLSLSSQTNLVNWEKEFQTLMNNINYHYEYQTLSSWIDDIREWLLGITPDNEIQKNSLQNILHDLIQAENMLKQIEAGAAVSNFDPIYNLLEQDQLVINDLYNELYPPPSLTEQKIWIQDWIEETINWIEKNLDEPQKNNLLETSRQFLADLENVNDEEKLKNLEKKFTVFEETLPFPTEEIIIQNWLNDLKSFLQNTTPTSPDLENKIKYLLKNITQAESLLIKTDSDSSLNENKDLVRLLPQIDQQLDQIINTLYPPQPFPERKKTDIEWVQNTINLIETDLEEEVGSTTNYRKSAKESLSELIAIDNQEDLMKFEEKFSAFAKDLPFLSEKESLFKWIFNIKLFLNNNQFPDLEKKTILKQLNNAENKLLMISDETNPSAFSEIYEILYPVEKHVNELLPPLTVGEITVEIMSWINHIQQFLSTAKKLNIDVSAYEKILAEILEQVYLIENNFDARETYATLKKLDEKITKNY
jgi:hypothetical protein